MEVDVSSAALIQPADEVPYANVLALPVAGLCRMKHIAKLEAPLDAVAKTIHRCFECDRRLALHVHPLLSSCLNGCTEPTHLLSSVCSA